MTLSPACCDAFIRSTPLPITPRDYYLRKLFQFIRGTLIARFEDRRLVAEVGLRLHELLDQIPAELLPPDGGISWIGIWWHFYEDTVAHSLPAVIADLERRITLALPDRTRPPGPLPEMDYHRIVEDTVKQIGLSGRDWKHELQGICLTLDKRNVPCFRGRARDKRTTWIAKLRMPGGKETIKKAIQYRLEQAAKIANRSN